MRDQWRETYGWNHRVCGRWLIVLLVGFLCLVGCSGPAAPTSPLSPLLTQSPFSPPPTPTRTATPTAAPTRMPTATRLPRLTPTGRLSPTTTPTPTPKPPSDFPTVAQAPEGWPALPMNLYFIRDGSLWRWSADGGRYRVVAAPQESRAVGQKLAKPAQGGAPTGVLAYRLTPDEHRVVYTYRETASPATYDIRLFDQITGDMYTLVNDVEASGWEARGPFLDITPDGRYVVYLAWGVTPTTLASALSRAPGLSAPSASPHAGGIRYGTLFAVDVQDPAQVTEVGYCTGESDYGWSLSCDGFVLSPDGARLAFSDGRGMWISEMPQGRPRLIAEHRTMQHFCGVWRVRRWAPDGQRLLINVGCYEGSGVGVMDVKTGAVQSVPRSRSYLNPHAEVRWVQKSGDLLVSQITGVEAQRETNHLVRVSMAATGPQTTRVLSATWPAAVWPTEPHVLPDGRIAFMNRLCVDSPEGRSGIYTVRPDGTELTLVAPLPSVRCYTSQGMPRSQTTVLWSPDGAAYVYLSGARRNPRLLGLTDGSTLWDVRALLSKAHDVQWPPPYAGYRR